MLIYGFCGGADGREVEVEEAAPLSLSSFMRNFKTR